MATQNATNNQGIGQGPTGYTGYTGPAGSGGGNGHATTFDVTQAAHGFVVGDVIRESGVANTYTKAQADSSDNGEVVGIVTFVDNVNQFTYTTQGIIEAGVPVAPAGTVFFLSDSVAGGLTTTAPTTPG